MTGEYNVAIVWGHTHYFVLHHFVGLQQFLRPTYRMQLLQWIVTSRPRNFRWKNQIFKNSIAFKVSPRFFTAHANYIIIYSKISQNLVASGASLFGFYFIPHFDHQNFGPQDPPRRSLLEDFANLAISGSGISSKFCPLQLANTWGFSLTY